MNKFMGIGLFRYSNINTFYDIIAIGC